LEGEGEEEGKKKERRRQGRKKGTGGLKAGSQGLPLPARKKAVPRACIHPRDRGRYSARKRAERKRRKEGKAMRTGRGGE